MNTSNLYRQTEVSGLNQIELESRALLKSASVLGDIKNHWEECKGRLPEALEKNNKLWSVISTCMAEEECPHTKEVKSNIMNLAVFVFRKSIELMREPSPEALDVLININYNIAKGLSETSE